MNPKDLNLYIVDDDEPVRRAVGALLVARLSDCSVKTFDSGRSFLEGAKLDSSGVVLLDLRMETEMSGLEVFAALKERGSPLVVVFMSGHGTLPVAVRALQDGAVTWLEKPCTNDQLLAAVEAAKARAVGIATARRDRHKALERWKKLSPRLKQIAPLVAGGMTCKAIAKEIQRQDPADVIDHRTIENHRAKIFALLDVPNSNALQAFMRDNDL